MQIFFLLPYCWFYACNTCEIGQGSKKSVDYYETLSRLEQDAAFFILQGFATTNEGLLYLSY